MRAIIALILAAASMAVEPGTRSALLLKQAEDASVSYVAVVLKVAHELTDVEPQLTDEQRKDLVATLEGRRYRFWQSVRSKIKGVEATEDITQRVDGCGHILNQLYGFLQAAPTVQPTPDPPPAKQRGGVVR